MEVVKINKKMIESLINLKNAFNQVNKEWINCDDMNELVFSNYPFNESFDELNLKVMDWVDISIEELKKKM